METLHEHKGHAARTANFHPKIKTVTISKPQVAAIVSLVDSKKPEGNSRSHFEKARCKPTEMTANIEPKIIKFSVGGVQRNGSEIQIEPDAIKAGNIIHARRIILGRSEERGGR